MNHMNEKKIHNNNNNNNTNKTIKQRTKYNNDQSLIASIIYRVIQNMLALLLYNIVLILDKNI